MHLVPFPVPLTITINDLLASGGLGLLEQARRLIHPYKQYNATYSLPKARRLLGGTDNRLIQTQVQHSISPMCGDTCTTKRWCFEHHVHLTKAVFLTNLKRAPTHNAKASFTPVMHGPQELANGDIPRLPYSLPKCIAAICHFQIPLQEVPFA